MYRNGALQGASALSFHLFPQTSSNATAAQIAKRVLMRVRGALHRDHLDAMQVWVDELSRAPNLNNMSDTTADRDFYSRVLAALDQATYRSGRRTIKALQGVFPYQADDDLPESQCPATPSSANVDLWCAAGMFFRSAGFGLKPAGAVVERDYHDARTWTSSPRPRRAWPPAR